MGSVFNIRKPKPTKNKNCKKAPYTDQETTRGGSSSMSTGSLMKISCQSFDALSWFNQRD